jgi:hypothetical protein
MRTLPRFRPGVPQQCGALRTRCASPNEQTQRMKNADMQGFGL